MKNYSNVLVAFSRKLNNMNTPWKILLKHYQCCNATTMTHFQGARTVNLLFYIFVLHRYGHRQAECFCVKRDYL